ncbi:MAG TPA: hypothetical protein VLH39_03605, partial [Magnetospirillaceae bacterium]|nr:hypothetical protein [Magnetospirillaceae bacterium]
MLDLSAFRDSVVALDGEWAFWWDRFLDPAILAAGRGPEPDAYGVIPGDWRNYGVPGAEAQGHGTYRLVVRGLDPGVRYALRMFSFSTAARVYANGRLLYMQGVPGSSRELEIPDWGSAVVGTEPDAEGVLDIVLHVSNYSGRAGGVQTGILAGPYSMVDSGRDRKRMIEAFLFGSILIMGVY